MGATLRQAQRSRCRPPEQAARTVGADTRPSLVVTRLRATGRACQGRPAGAARPGWCFLTNAGQARRWGTAIAWQGLGARARQRVPSRSNGIPPRCHPGGTPSLPGSSHGPLALVGGGRWSPRVVEPVPRVDLPLRQRRSRGLGDHSGTRLDAPVIRKRRGIVIAAHQLARAAGHDSSSPRVRSFGGVRLRLPWSRCLA
jgi:hypothetical protein